MKLIHTSDWHLGRTFHGLDMLPYQAAQLDHLVGLARTVRPAAVLVAGDVYDRAVPPVAAVEVLEGALRRLAEVAPVVVISGNHDSATRLGFGAALMRPEIRLVTALNQVGEAVALADPAGGPGALVYPIPFLDVYDAAARWGAEDEPLARSHEAVLGAAMGRVRADLSRRGLAPPSQPDGGPAVVVMAHAFVSGALGSESERDLTVGGVDRVPAAVFAGADYVALGHLHGPQVVSGQAGQVLRYSGAPLAFSFSEAGQVKSTAVVSLGAGPPAVELVPAPVPRPLRVVAGTLAQLQAAASDDLAGAWVKATVTDAARPDDLTAQVRRIFPHLLQLEHVPEGFSAQAAASRVTAASDPAAVAAEFIQYAGGVPASAPELAVVDAALEAARLAVDQERGRPAAGGGNQGEKE
ncbi:MAG: exonuclease SbcCD subunit D [Bifidobacteriaceae bacterium]|nr:exonuclease SbcCD subunit D [Bifidobacteriaceae bacterium]